MGAERAIQIAIARADLLLCSVRALPWGRICLSLLIAAIFLGVVRRHEQ